MDLSIIIPIFNTQEYLKDCLASVRKGIGRLDAEVLLIDDGSTDASAAVAKEFCGKNPSFRYIHKENEGVSIARNYAVALAKGKYIQFIDSDDLVADKIFEEMFASAEYNHADVTLCYMTRVKAGKYSVSPIHQRAFHDLRGTVTDLCHSPQISYNSTPCNAMIRRSFYETYEFRFPEGIRFEDMPFMAAVLWKAERISIIRRTGYYWRIREGSNLQNTMDGESLDNFRDKIESMTRMFAYLKEQDAAPQVRKAFTEKAFKMDFFLFLNLIPKMEPAFGETIVGTLSEFYQWVLEINGFTLAQLALPLTIRQIAHDLFAGDIENLKRVLAYRQVNNANAPILEDENGFRKVLPEDIFTIPDRDITFEYHDAPPRCRIDRMEIKGSAVLLYGHLYTRRINLPEENEQKLGAYLINEITGAVLPLTVGPWTCPFLTRDQGTVLNYDDYRYYHYDYDGAGFVITLDQETFEEAPEHMGRNVLIMQYENRMMQGVRIFRGMPEKIKKQMLAWKGIGPHYCGRFGVDVRDTVFYILEDGLESVSGLTKENDELKTSNREFEKLHALTIKEIAKVRKENEEMEKRLELLKENEILMEINRKHADTYAEEERALKSARRQQSILAGDLLSAYDRMEEALKESAAQLEKEKAALAKEKETSAKLRAQIAKIKGSKTYKLGNFFAKIYRGLFGWLHRR